MFMLLDLGALLFCILKCTHTSFRTAWCCLDFIFFLEPTSLISVLFCFWHSWHSMASYHCWTEETFITFHLLWMNKIRENKWGSHGLSNATKLPRQIQEIGEIWEGFSQWQLDFGSSCGFTTAAAERKPHIETGKKGLEIYMHRLERALLDFALPLLCFMAFLC